jgi:hypothetical protein
VVVVAFEQATQTSKQVNAIAAFASARRLAAVASVASRFLTAARGCFTTSGLGFAAIRLAAATATTVPEHPIEKIEAKALATEAYADD